VTRVLAGGPAEEAGLLRGDVVVSVSGDPVVSADDLRAVVASREIGRPLELELIRAGSERRAELVPVEEGLLVQKDLTIPAEAVEWAGMVLVPAQADWRARLGVSIPERRYPGLLVLSLDAKGAGARAGLQVGDVLLDCQRRSIRDADHLLVLTQGHRNVVFRFWRGAGEAYAAVALDE
jgi:serine protease Do